MDVNSGVGELSGRDTDHSAMKLDRQRKSRGSPKPAFDGQRPDAVCVCFAIVTIRFHVQLVAHRRSVCGEYV